MICCLAFRREILAESALPSDMKQTLKVIAILLGLCLILDQAPAMFNDLIGARKWIEFGNPDGLYGTEYCEQAFWLSPVKRYALKTENHPEWGHPKNEGAVWAMREELPDGQLGDAKRWAGSFEMRAPHVDLKNTDE
jgi:hypothetical protein